MYTVKTVSAALIIEPSKYYFTINKGLNSK